MKKILTLLLVIFGLAIATNQAHAAPSFIQGSYWNAYIASGATTTLPMHTTSGNQLIIMSDWSYLGCPPSYTDTEGNTFTLQGANPMPNSGEYLFIATAPIGSSATDTITQTASCGSSYTAYALEYSGLASNPYDTEAIFNNSSTQSTCYSGTSTPSTNGDLILSFFTNQTGGAMTINSPFTLRVSGALNFPLGDYVQSTAAAISATASCSVTPTYYGSGFLATFKAAASSPTPVKQFWNTVLSWFDW
jgi:hypothetical protein